MPTAADGHQESEKGNLISSPNERIEAPLLAGTPRGLLYYTVNREKIGLPATTNKYDSLSREDEP
jgi:hypothetical protein